MRLALLVALAACGPELTIHERTAPIRIEVTKRAKPAQLRVEAWLRGDTVEVVAKRASEVEIQRTVHYGSTAFDMLPSNPLAEILEIPAGIVVALMPATWAGPYRVPNTSTRVGVRHTSWVLALLNPFQTSIRYRVRTGPSTGVFADPPTVRDVEVRLPAAGLTVPYRILDEGERPIGAGSVTMDSFGRAAIAGAAGAVAIEVTIDGKPTIVPVELEAPPDAPDR